MYQAGIVFLEDLIGDNGKVMNIQELNDRSNGVAHWLELHALLQAIPKEWHNIIELRTEFDTIHVANYTRLINVKKATPIVYRALTSKPTIAMKSYQSWMKVDFFECTVQDYMRNFTSLYRLTISTKLRDFQYRLLHKRLPSNRELFRWKIKPTEKCDFCQDTDSIEHTLYECNKINSIWTEFAMFICNRYENCIFVVNLTEVILNRIHK